jgi:two-component system phosphate regulon response regulator PhoB
MNHTILIIEDDDFLRSLAVAKLEKEGFTVRMAANGQEGLAVLNEQTPDLLILDLMLPLVSGFDILKTLRANAATAGLKVIVFSNMGEEADIKTCLDLGVTDYLVKANFTLDELVEKIKTVLV